MYFRLVQAFPDHVVLAQVAFSALLATRDRPTRATFDRKVADFVLCNKGFVVSAVLELDDASHKSRRAQDAAREALLRKVGYRVLRFKNVPELRELQAALLNEAPPEPTEANRRTPGAA